VRMLHNQQLIRDLPPLALLDKLALKRECIAITHAAEVPNFARAHR
jgi:hypothetical protein